MTKKFNVVVHCVETSDNFPIKDVTNSTKIFELKIRLELVAGIPTHLQRIMYLDQGDMEDSSTLRHHDVVADSKLTLTIWKTWSQLVQASAKGDIKDVMALGVTANSSYRNPNIDHMSEEKKRECFLNRAFIALYVAVHRGHIPLIKTLLNKTGVDINESTKNNRNILHVAAANGREQCIDLLLDSGAGNLIHNVDDFGVSALQTAATCGHKSSEGKLFLFQWRQRASKLDKIPLATRDQLMAHQFYDSSGKTWLYGRQSQVYQSNLLPPQEYRGSSLSSRRSDFGVKNAKSVSSSSKPGTSTKQLTAQHTAVIRPAKLVQSDDAVLTRGRIKEGFEEILPLHRHTSSPGVFQQQSGSSSKVLNDKNRERPSWRSRQQKPEDSLRRSLKQAS